MLLSRFNFNLPERLVAQVPALPRDKCRLLVYDRNSQKLIDDVFYNIVKLLDKNDILVFNRTTVIPSRLRFKLDGSNFEILFLKNFENNDWIVLASPGRKLFNIGKVKIKDLDIFFKKKTSSGEYVVSVSKSYDEMMDFFDKSGELPLPNYIKNRKFDDFYQTEFKKSGFSVAAPTAGLHFTKTLLNKLSKKGVKIAFVNLNVGLGTFKPIIVKDIRKHKMHFEEYSIDSVTSKILNDAKKSNNRIIAVGTTTLRALESNFDKFGKIVSGTYKTDIFLSKSDQFKLIDGLITNFHLPKSSLFILVSALLGKDLAQRIYRYAIIRRYRFYSFGDAMLIK